LWHFFQSLHKEGFKKGSGWKNFEQIIKHLIVTEAWKEVTIFWKYLIKSTQTMLHVERYYNNLTIWAFFLPSIYEKIIIKRSMSLFCYRHKPSNLQKWKPSLNQWRRKASLLVTAKNILLYVIEENSITYGELSWLWQSMDINLVVSPYLRF
jgi:hypothetical protein